MRCTNRRHELIEQDAQPGERPGGPRRPGRPLVAEREPLASPSRTPRSSTASTIVTSAVATTATAQEREPPAGDRGEPEFRGAGRSGRRSSAPEKRVREPRQGGAPALSRRPRGQRGDGRGASPRRWGKMNDHRARGARAFPAPSRGPAHRKRARGWRSRRRSPRALDQVSKGGATLPPPRRYRVGGATRDVTMAHRGVERRQPLATTRRPARGESTPRLARPRERPSPACVAPQRREATVGARPRLATSRPRSEDRTSGMHPRNSLFFSPTRGRSKGSMTLHQRPPRHSTTTRKWSAPAPERVTTIAGKQSAAGKQGSCREARAFRASRAPSLGREIGQRVDARPVDRRFGIDRARPRKERRCRRPLQHGPSGPPVRNR